MAEHVLQVGVCVDDDAIQKAVVMALAKDIKTSMPSALNGNRHGYRPCNMEEALRDFTGDCVRSFLEAHTDAIVDAASDKLYEYMKRTKAVKEATERCIKEV